VVRSAAHTVHGFLATRSMTALVVVVVTVTAVASLF
jgi:hypothetical protein